MPEPLLILGASARAAAFSARRAGFQPVCGDLFADADLQACCTAVAVTDYPDGLEQVASEAPPAAWMYTGGLENYPQLVERIARGRPLLGVGSAELQRVRDPRLVAAALQASGLPVPACQSTSSGLPADGSWLAKGRRSSGGGQVFAWRGQRRFSSGGDAWYFQRRIDGQPCAALFVAACGRAVLLGVTEQLLLGQQADRPYSYAGSIGPLRLTPELTGRFECLGNVLAADFQLTGLFGVDAVFAAGEVWPVEINPRYPASAEIVERATGASTVALHVAACREAMLPSCTPAIISDGWHGKRILYSRCNAVVSEELARQWFELNLATPWPEAADVPAAGAKIGAGQPVMTLFAQAEDRTLLRQVLAEREEFWQRRLAGGR